MYPFKNAEMAAENGKLSTRPKKSSKRKRQLSKREPDGDDHTPAVPGADKSGEKIGQNSSGTNSSIGCNSDKSKNTSRATYPASKKKPLGFVKVPKVVPKQDNTTKMKKKKKKKGKMLNAGDLQNLEKELEACVLLNGVPKDVTSKADSKKAKPVKAKPKKDDAGDMCSDDVSGMWANDSGLVSSADLAKPSKKGSPFEHGASADIPTKPRKTSRKSAKKLKNKTVISNQAVKAKPKNSSWHPNYDDVSDMWVDDVGDIWSDGVSGMWENDSGLVSNADLTTPSEKGSPFEHGASADIPTKTRKTSRKSAKKLKEKTAVSNQKGRKAGSDKKEEMFRMKEEARALELKWKKQIVCYPEEIFSVGRDSYVVVLLPGQSLYLHGLISVRPLVGKVTILGYRVKTLEKQDVHSFNSHALLSVKAEEGCKLSVSHHLHLLEYGLSREQLQDTAHKQVGPVVVVELRRANLPIVRRLAVIRQQQLMMPKEQKCRKTLGGMLITHANCSNYHLVDEGTEWRELVDNIRLYFECGNAPRVVVCGGKGVGKSTVFRYVVNGLLGENCTKVQCLDIDPGQTELSVPSCLSLTEITEPLLGPAYTHHFDPSSPNVKQILIGGVSPQFGLQRYVKAVKKLFNLSKNHPDIPLVVNTMGWTVGTGLDLIFDTIRIVKPSHVIQIQGSNFKNNFGVRLDDCVVQGSRGGVRTMPSKSSLHYSLIELKSLSGRKDKVVTFTPKLLRELAVMLHLSDLLIDFLENPSDREGSARHAVIVPWPEVVLHVCGARLPRQRILQVLNGNLVALCHVDSSKIEFISPDLPKHLIDDLDFGQCWGWGVVRGIDPLTKSLHIMTSLPSEIIRREMNAVIMPELYLPDKFYGFFTKGEGPYYQKLSRSGAGRLKVSRQIKPGMAKLGPRNKD